MRAPLMLLFALLSVSTAVAEADDRSAIQRALSAQVIDGDLPWREVREFCSDRVPPMPEASSAAEWEQYAERTRSAVLDGVVFRGEAEQWRRLPTRVEWLETIEGGPEYVIRKLRYEAVPGMWIPALLYEPKELTGTVPVVLNVNGHDGDGKAADYKQVRCINQAKRGMLALNVEWLGMGQLRGDDFVHYRMNQLDLCGTSGLSPFYLSMSRALDVLLQQEHADPERVAVAGLSGGGWQTIFISALDTRVTLSNPVAGYSSFLTRAEFTSDLGDSEQTPCDLATVTDYVQLTAMRAPRPTLLTFNDRDQCCFAAGHALPPLLHAARRVYRLYGRLENLVAHVNHQPGHHNFEQDNREALYRMLGEHCYAGEEFDWREIECGEEVKTADELHVELPEENAGFNTIARRLMDELPSPPQGDADAQRERLREIVHAHDWHVEVGEATLGEPIGGVQVLRWPARIGDDWTVPVVEFRPAESGAQPPVIVVADEGRTAAAARVGELLDAGRRVLAVDPFYFGESRISRRDFLYGLLVSAVGERPLGIQASQLIALSRRLSEQDATEPVEIVAIGRRTSLIALTAAALAPESIGGVELHRPMTSLKQVIGGSLQIPDGPELFCFGLLKEFDVLQMRDLVAPRPVEIVD